ARSGCDIAIRRRIDGRLPGHVETAAFRIVQEAVNNAIRHGRATHIAVELETDASSVTVTICDDGCGFDPDLEGDDGCFGLLSMRERAELLGGSFSLVAAVGKGVAVKARLPLASAAATPR